MAMLAYTDASNAPAAAGRIGGADRHTAKAACQGLVSQCKTRRSPPGHYETETERSPATRTNDDNR